MVRQAPTKAIISGYQELYDRNRRVLKCIVSIYHKTAAKKVITELNQQLTKQVSTKRVHRELHAARYVQLLNLSSQKQILQRAKNGEMTIRIEQ